MKTWIVVVIVIGGIMALLRNNAIRNHPAIRTYPTDERSWRIFTEALDAQSADSTVSAYKTSVTQRDTTETLTADPDLQITLQASAIYKISVVLFFQGELATSGNQGFNFGMAYSGTAALVSTALGIKIINGTPSVHSGATGAFEVTSPIPSGVAPISVTPYVDGFEMTYFIATTTGGTLSVNWAQAASSGDYTRVVTGSSLVALRLN